MSTASTSATLRVHAVHAGYRPGHEILRDVTAAAEPGQLTALIGPNASGKTTLLRTMLNQTEVHRGQVTLQDRPTAKWSAAELARQVAYVPQRGGGCFGYSVRQMVAMGRHAHRDQRYIDEAIRVCSITDLADADAQRLSGGQQQRVMMARAWAQSRGASVLLADEPVAGLDLGHAYETMQLLHDMSREGLAVVVVLHSLELAARWADRVWLMQAGRLVADDKTHQVMTRERLESVYHVSLNESRIDGVAVFSVQGVQGIQGVARP
jgi:iron complex transport system ATP-binding protein